MNETPKLQHEDQNKFPAGIPPTATQSTPAQELPLKDTPVPATLDFHPDLENDRGTGHFGEYQLLEKLGEGGMGLVYKARHKRLKRLVALKVILTGKQARQSDLERFRIEAETVARLQHPRIVQIFEIGEHDGQPFLALEYCAGGTLADRLRGTPMPPRQAAELIRELAEATEAAHQRHVVHRDLKPANVLFTSAPARQGERGLEAPKITDFGLAKKLDEFEGLTQENAIMGTPSYMAPEQASGKGREVGPGADIYALGAILYECLTGRPPFRAATSLDTLLQVVRDEPVPVRQLNPKVPADLETVCLKCLEKDARRRYASAQVLAEELRRFLNGEPIQVRPIRRGERAWRWCRKHPAVAALAAAVLLVLLAGIGVSAWFAIQANASADEALGLVAEKDDLATKEKEAREDAEKKTKQAEDLAGKMTLLAESEKAAHKDAAQKKEQAEKSAKTTRWTLYTSQLLTMAQAWKEHDFGRLEQLLRESTPQQEEPDFRGWEWYYLQDQYLQSAVTLQKEGTCNGVAAWCRETGQIAVATKDGAIEIWDAARRKLEQTLPAQKGPITGLTWAPDGKRLACLADNVVATWEVSSAKKQYQLPGQPTKILALAWSDDGKHLATGGMDARIYIWDAQQGKFLRTIGPNETSVIRYVCSLAWHPDGVRIAAGCRFGYCEVWNTQTGKLVFSKFSPDTTGASANAVAWTPDGKKVAVGGVPTMLICSDTGQVLSSLAVGASDVFSLQWSPDGTHLLSGGADHLTTVWDGRTGQKIRSLQLHSSPVGTVAWSQDGKRVLSASDQVKLCYWDQEVAKAARIKVGGIDLFDLAWSPNGQWLACTGDAALTCICNATTGKITHQQSLPQGKNNTACYSVAWSPDSSRFAALLYTGKVFVLDAPLGINKQILPLPLIKGDGYIGGYHNLAWSPNGKWVAITNVYADTVLWDTSNWQQVGPLGQTRFFCVAWSPDSRFLAGVGNEGHFSVWDVATRKRIYQQPCGFARLQISWSPDGRLIAAALESGAIAFFRAEDGKLIHTAIGHKGPVNRVQWSSDGSRLASASKDGTVKIWDAATGMNLMTLPCDGISVFGLAWSPNNRQLACCGDDGSIRVWGSPDIADPSPLATHLESGVLASVKKGKR